MYNSEDSSSVQHYDCIDHQSIPYCRRLSQPTRLQRDDDSGHCYFSGKSHVFRSLRANGTTVLSVMGKWKSTVDNADQYAHYLRQPVDSKEGDKQLCECIDPQSFGKNCEYMLPLGSTFMDVVNAKFSVTSGKLMYLGEIVCYDTLKCDFGLVCLDWRDICDGVQQCMFGLDEENCDKLEFNECEEDEYRCMNGMCIPDQYFLDGEYDCMDMSDEKGPFDDTKCPYQSASMDCDDRVCLPDRWSCGDGQCIKERRLAGDHSIDYTPCFNRRDQFFWCEAVVGEDLWTQENGRCSDTLREIPISMKNCCVHLLYCTKPSWDNKNYPCLNNKTECVELYRKNCPSDLLRYPDGGLITPYSFEYYNIRPDWSHSSVYLFNGTIKCRGYLASFNYKASYDSFNAPSTYIESLLCSLASNRANFSHAGYHRHCHNESLTFNNRSYHWIDVCAKSSECISAYRINDGFENCHRSSDEIRNNGLVSKSCFTVQRHRFRCSLAQATCLPVNTLADLARRCDSTGHTLSRSIQVAISRVQCNSQPTADCPLLRELIEASWNHSLYNYTGSRKSQLKKTPFRSYCDTFQDTLSNEDEDSVLCQSLWTCLAEEWQCHAGHCIDFEWVLDGEWDCPDGSDEENMFAIGFNASHGNSKWLNKDSFITKFRERFQNLSLPMICRAVIMCACSIEGIARPSNCTPVYTSTAPSTVNSTGCAAEYDQDYVSAYCIRTRMALGDPIECSSVNTSMVSAFTFRKRCSITREDDGEQAKDQSNRQQNVSRQNVTCWDRNIKQSSKCGEIQQCLYGEDQFLCGQERFLQTFYRAEKQDQVRQKKKKVRLPPFPIHANSSWTTSDQTTAPNSASVTLSLLSTLPSLLNWCNRGIPIWTHNQSFVCFCPPQYHGDQCQFHSDRITLLLHVNYTHSAYTASTNPTIVHKFLVLFSSDKQVISTDEFHIRPAIDIPNSRKKKIHLHYSRSADYAKEKKKRYFNRSNIVYEHPFSVRIEAYAPKANLQTRRFAVWLYLGM